MQSKMINRKAGLLLASLGVLAVGTVPAEAQVRLGWVRSTGTNPTLAVTRNAAGEVFTFGNGTVNKHSKTGTLVWTKTVGTFTYGTTVANNIVSLHAGQDGGVYLVERQGPNYSSTVIRYCNNNGVVGFTRTITGHLVTTFNSSFPIAKSDASGNLFLVAQTGTYQVNLYKVTPGNVLSTAAVTVSNNELLPSEPYSLFVSSLIVPDNAGGAALFVDHSDGKGHANRRFNAALATTQTVNYATTSYERWAQGSEESAVVKNGLIYAIRNTTDILGATTGKDLIEVAADGTRAIKRSGTDLRGVSLSHTGNLAVVTASSVTRNSTTYPAFNVGLENTAGTITTPVRAFANFGSTTPIQFGRLTTTPVNGANSNPFGLSYSSGVANGAFYVVNGVEDATSTFAGPWPVRFSQVGLNVADTASVVNLSTYMSPNRFFFNNSAAYSTGTGSLLWSGPLTTAFSDDGIYAALTVAGNASVAKYHFTAPTVTGQPSTIPGGPGATDQVITLTGDKFGYNDVFRINGVACATNVVSDGSLQVTIPASAISVKGIYPISLGYTFENGTTNTLDLGSIEVGPRPVLDVASLAPNPLHGGEDLTFTVSLNEPAGFPGQTVTVTNTNPAVTLPGTVSFATGETTKTFTIVPSYVTTDTTGDVTSVLDGVTKTSTLTVLSHKVAALDVTPSTVIGGNSSVGTVTLTSKAAPGGYVVALSSDNPAITVPAEVTVAAGETTATFPVDYDVVADDSNGVLTAQLNGSSKTSNVTVKAANITSLGLSKTSTAGGNDVTGTVTLDGMAPAGGLTVTLSSSNSKVVVPASVTIPEGMSEATFTATTVPTAVATPVIVTASARGVVLNKDITITAPVVVSVVSNPTSITGSNTGTATVMLDGPAPTSWNVTVTSDNPALGFGLAAGVPIATKATSVSAGARSVNVGINTAYVTADTAVNVTATRAGVSATTVVNVLPPAPASVVLTPASVRGGVNTSLRVNITAKAPVGGLVVTLASNRSEATPVAMVTVPAGQTFTTTSVPTKAVSANATAVLSATAYGYTKTATLAITPSVPSSVAMTPNAVVGGVSSTGRVTLNGAAGPDGAVVTLVSSSPKVTVPATVTVPAGATSATFTASTVSVPSNISATVRASFNGTTVTGTLTVQAPKPSAVAYNPVVLTGGKSGVGTVTLNGRAPAGGYEVLLAADNGIFTIPASVTVAEGALSATFPVSALVVDTNTVVTTTATANGTTVTKTITVAAPVLYTVTVASMLNGGASTVGKVTLTGVAPVGGVTVSLVSNNPAVSVPASVTVPEGALSANFTATSVAVNADTTGTVVATQGTVSKSANVTVRAAVVSAITASPSSLKGGNNITFRVTLGSAAGPSGAVVMLTSANSAVTVPATVTVPAGASTVTFTGTTTAVTAITSG
ncbi:MAG: beta strand repeat-containing protein, partial [Armatimonadaceae bacterium]